MANAALAITVVDERVDLAALEAEWEEADRLELERQEVLEFIMNAHLDEMSGEDGPFNQFPREIMVGYYDYFKAHRAVIDTMVEEGVLKERMPGQYWNRAMIVTEKGIMELRKLGLLPDPLEWPE